MSRILTQKNSRVVSAELFVAHRAFFPMLQSVLRRVSAGALLVRCVSSATSGGVEPGLALSPGWHADLPAAKKLVFIRHAEGWHNKDAREIPNYFKDELGLASTSLKYWDAALTPEGETQCAALALRLQEQVGSLELVAVSPMTRALQTATLAFPNASARPPFLATSLARERVWLHACDGRRPRSELQRDFAHVDFGEVTSEIDEMFELKENEPSDRNSTRCAERATRLLQWLHARPEQGIAVVSHWVFLTHLFQPFAHAEFRQPFGNAEARLVTLFVPGIGKRHVGSSQVAREERTDRDEL